MKSFVWFAFVATLCGCASISDRNSLTMPLALVNITSAPLSGDFNSVANIDELKCGVSDEEWYFSWPYPPITVSLDDMTIQSAMKNGGIKEVCFADYEQKHYVIVSFYKVRVYGR